MDLEVKADSRYRFNRKKIRESVAKLLTEQNIKQKVELSLMVVGERKIRELEKKYFGEDKVTDVLSFPQMDPPSRKASEGQGGSEIWEEKHDVLALGDIVVCYPQAKRQALKFNRLLDDEIEFLVNHGVLHLLGIHHD